MNEMNYTTIFSWLEEIETEMKKKVSIDVPTDVLEKLGNLSEMLATNSQCVAWSEKIYNLKLGKLITAEAYKGMAMTDKKILFASLAAEEIRCMTLAEVQSKDLHYEIEALRSMLSYLKAEMDAAKTQKT
jgi:hypothetical protein